MKTKLIFATETRDTEQWSDLPFTPRINEWFNVSNIVKKEDVAVIQQSAYCWSGIRGTVQSVEYFHNDNEFYAEVFIWCED